MMNGIIITMIISAIIIGSKLVVIIAVRTPFTGHLLGVNHSAD